MTDLLGGADGPLWAAMHSFMVSPVEHLGLVLASASIAVGLVLRWVRRAARA